MPIFIAERLNPFSHLPGTCFLLPLTSWKVNVYPTRLQFFDLNGQAPDFFLDFPFKGPVKEFTAQLDLEQFRLNVWGRTKEGWMRYALFVHQGKTLLCFEKMPGNTCVISHSSGFYHSLYKEEPFEIGAASMQTPCLERLSLGLSKSLEWEKVKQRCNLKELFPLWLRLGQQLPKMEGSSEGIFALLEECANKVMAKDKVQLEEVFTTFFLASFEGVFVPRLEDTDFQGIIEKKALATQDKKALFLLQKSAEIIRSLFFKEEEGKIALLPCLLPSFACGRMKGMTTSSQAVLDIEWTKHFLRNVSLRSLSQQTLLLQLPKGVVSCRIRKDKTVEDKKKIGKDRLLEVPLFPGVETWLDRFEA